MIVIFNIVLPYNDIFGSVQSIAYVTLLERYDDNALSRMVSMQPTPTALLLKEMRM
jgi:hypothetical protein